MTAVQITKKLIPESIARVIWPVSTKLLKTQAQIKHVKNFHQHTHSLKRQFSVNGGSQWNSHPSNFQKNTLLYNTHNQRTLTTSSFHLDERKKRCTIQWDDGFQAEFHSVWLRQNCHCDKCRHSNGQRLIESGSIPHSIQIESIDFKDSQVNIKWNGEDHEGYLPIKYLRDNNYNEERLMSIREEVKMDLSMKEIPLVNYDEIEQSEEGKFKWMKQINDYGVSVIKNAPLELGMVQKVGEMIAPVWNSIYGMIFDVKSEPNPINLAFTSLALDYHMDLVYFESPPGLQLLHCLQFDESIKGGQSILLDIYAHAEDFRVNHPEHFHTLTTVPATFQKIHYEREYPVHIVNQKPHIKLNHYGDIVAIYWSPPFEGPLCVSGKDVDRYYAAYELFASLMITSPHQKTYRMVPGDVLVFNNIRMLHGRSSFDTNEGHRHLQGCYVNIDFFKSRSQILNNLYGDGKLVKRVGNQCWR